MKILLPDKPDILDQSEIERLTGRVRLKEQIAWLDNNNWRYTKNAANEPIISRLYFLLRTTGIDAEEIMRDKVNGPNWDALNP